MSLPAQLYSACLCPQAQRHLIYHPLVHIVMQFQILLHCQPCLSLTCTLVGCPSVSLAFLLFSSPWVLSMEKEDTCLVPLLPVAVASGQWWEPKHHQTTGSNQIMYNTTVNNTTQHNLFEYQHIIRSIFAQKGIQHVYYHRQ